MGFAQVVLGLNEEGIASLDMSRRLAPGDLGSAMTAQYRAIAHFQAGRLDQAADAIDQAFVIDPARVGILLIRTAIASLAGRSEDARDSLRRLKQVTPSATAEHSLLRLVGFMNLASPARSVFEAALHKVWDETPMEPAAN